MVRTAATSRPRPRPAAKPKKADVEEPDLPGAVRRALPATLSPQLAMLARSAPTDGGWMYEIKFDGYRLLARLERGRAAIFTRGGLDWTAKLAPIAREIEGLGLASCWLDGEAVVLDAQGRPRFNALQNALDAARNGTILYYLFDMPFANGLDLRQVPLHARRALLKRILAAHEGDRLRFSEDFPSDAAHVLQTACGMHLEGVIAKRRDGAYTSARSADWLKLKCQARQEFVIGGFSDRSDNAAAVGGLALGYHDADGGLRFAGRVGTGWSSKEAVALRERLVPLVRDKPPFAPGGTRALPRLGPRDHWVAPRLVAEIEFSEWTPDGSLRHPSYQGLREDKPARAVTRERASAPKREGESPARGARRAATTATKGRAT
jgi:bifunctional non-homologous end joining protein LigD